MSWPKSLSKSKSRWKQDRRDGLFREVSRDNALTSLVENLQEKDIVTKENADQLRSVLRDNRNIFPYHHSREEVYSPRTNPQYVWPKHLYDVAGADPRKKALALRIYDALLNISEDYTGGMPTDEVIIHVYHSRSRKKRCGSVYRDIGPKSLELIADYLRSTNRM